VKAPHYWKRMLTRFLPLSIRRHALAAVGLATLCNFAHAQSTPVTLVIGTQDAAWPVIVAQSHVLDGTPYKVQWAVLTGPAAQLSALYSKAIDVGLMGDTSLIVEQGNARADWTPDTVPLQIIAGWRNPDKAYPPIVTVVNNGAGIKTLADLKGKTWAYNYGGFNYLQYVLSYNKAALKPADIQAVRFGDGNVSASAFSSGRTQVYSGGYGPVKETIDAGKAHVLLNSDELGIPALSVFAARSDVLKDADKRKALGDFLGRLQKSWVWWSQNIPVVEKIYHEKMNQSVARAQYSATSGASVFFPLDATLSTQEQHIADELVKSGDIKKKIDVTIEFNPLFNGNTVPAKP